MNCKFCGSNETGEDCEYIVDGKLTCYDCGERFEPLEEPKSEKKVILVTVVHNRQNYLREALDSALGSSLDKKHWVHLVIDSGSTQPECREIIKEYCDKWDHMYYKFFDENINQMPAYNYALKYVQEEWPEILYFSCLDSDDRLAQASLEKGLETMESDERIGIIYTDFNIIDGKSRVSVRKHLKSKRLVPEDIELEEEGQRRYRRFQINAKSGNFATHFRMIKIADLVEKMKGFDESRPYSTDFSIYSFALDSGVVLKKVDVVLYHWRVQNTKGRKNQTIQVQANHGEIQRNDYLELREYFEKKWKEEGRI